MDVARRIRQLRPDCLLIFITNFVEYSLEGYEVQAFRYLLKSEVEKKLNTYLAQAISVFDKTHDCIRLNCEGDETDIPLSSLLYAETELRYLRLHVNAGPRDTLRTRMTMSELDSKLQSRGFLRVHKSFLVNMEYIQKLQSTAVYLPSGKTLPVSGHSYGKIKQEYLQWKGRARWAGD
jgi:DNA-binding LytR/AlgR family response regulator